MNSRVWAAVTAINQLYEVHCTGGMLHIVTDDWNLEDHHVESCLTMQGEPPGRPFDEIESLAYVALIRLTVEERASALAIADGFYDAE
ncbi:MAG: hypothetical protein ACYTBJ_25960 [Planctomycetota bacterium]|jgi:hypothetical protein